MDALSKDNARRTSILQVAWIIAVLAALPSTKALALDHDQQEQPRLLNEKQARLEPGTTEVASGQAEQFSDEKSTVSSGWRTVFLCTVSVIGLALFCLFAGAGAGATVIALLWTAPDKHGGPARLTHPSWRPFTPNLFKRSAFKTEHFVRLHFDPANWKPQQVVRAASQDAKSWLVRFIPSRRQALQLACFALGIALMVLSGFWFVDGQALIGFLLMTSGYVIIAAVWMSSWSRGAGTTNTFIDVQTRRDKVRLSAEKALPNTLVTVQQSRVEQDLVAPAINLGLSTATHWHSVDCAPSHPRPESAESSRRLRCGDCKTQYNVRGRGKLSSRLIPCPRCGIALQAADGEQSSVSMSEFAWAPIISIFCRQCRSLIDVPYTSIGASVCCPRCEGHLPVPDTEDRVKVLRQMSNNL